MLFLKSTCAATTILAAATCGIAQLPDPPVGTPQGTIGGQYRPLFHFSPPKNFMNDPNGMFRDADGLWHLYYQWNYNNIVAGNQSWGHATSPDLYTWSHHPVAILPSRIGEGIFSGSAVIDVNNTSNFFPSQSNGVVAVYTLHNETEQTQNLAFSYDGGYTFTKYAGNPVISINSTGFRDPKVFWHKETERWVMIVAHPEFRFLSFYNSVNLVEWEEVSRIEEIGWLAVLYECPGLEKVRVEGTEDEWKWVLILSLNPGAPQGGSFTEYFFGDFNGTHFELDDGATRAYSFGKDDYALQYFYRDDWLKPAVNMGWASNWLYTNHVPTGTLEGFHGAMTLPRETVVKYTSPKAFPRGLVLASQPYNLPHLLSFRKTCILSLSSNKKEEGTNTDSITSPIPNPSTSAIWFNITITNLPPTPAGTTLGGNFTLTLSNSNHERLSLGWWATGEFYVNRQHLRGFLHPLYDGNGNSIIYAARNDDGSWGVYGLWDRSVMEVFVNCGVDTGVWVGYPDEDLDRVGWEIGGFGDGVQWEMEVWGMER